MLFARRTLPLLLALCLSCTSGYAKRVHEENPPPPPPRRAALQDFVLGTQPLPNAITAAAIAAEPEAYSDTAPPPVTPEAPHIVIADRYELGQKIVLAVSGTALEGAQATYAWTIEGVDSEAADGGKRLYVWSKSGTYRVDLAVTYTIQILVPDPKDPTKGVPKGLTLPPYIYTATLRVGDAEPDPVPPPDPPPNPPTGLAALVPNPAHRALLAEFYSDMATVVRAGGPTTTTHFRE